MAITTESSAKAKKPVARGSKKKKKSVSLVYFHVQATFNNTKITLTDHLGNVLAWTSSGREGFKGARKSTPFAAQIAASKLEAIACDDFSAQSCVILIKGPGPGRDACKGMSRLKLQEIWDVTPIPHNGVQPPKERRV